MQPKCTHSQLQEHISTILGLGRQAESSVQRHLATLLTAWVLKKINLKKREGREEREESMYVPMCQWECKNYLEICLPIRQLHEGEGENIL